MKYDFTDELKIVRIHSIVIGYKEDLYTNDRTGNTYISWWKADNIDDVNMEDIDMLVMKRERSGRFRIIQAGGFSKTRGRFIDMY